MKFTGAVHILDGAEYFGKQVSEANKFALGEAVKTWWRVFMPEHFEVEATVKYGYQPRKGDNEPPTVLKRVYKNQYDKVGTMRMVRNNAYSWKKRRKFKHNRPLVFTGKSYQMARSQITVRTGKRKSGEIFARGAMPVPHYFYKYRKDLNQPDKYAELTKTTPAEVGVLTQEVNRQIGIYLRRMPPKKTTIRVA